MEYIRNIVTNKGNLEITKSLSLGLMIASGIVGLAFIFKLKVMVFAVCFIVSYASYHVYGLASKLLSLDDSDRMKLVYESLAKFNLLKGK